MSYLLRELNERGIPKLLAGIKNVEQWKDKKETIKNKWKEYIGEIPHTVPVKYEIVSEVKEIDHIRQHIVYDTVYNDKVTAYLLIPDFATEKFNKGRRLPAVLALHPTNKTGKEDVATSKGRTNRTYGLELVSRGYIVLAPDTLAAGERVYSGYQSFHNEPFYEEYPEWSAVAKNIVDHMQGVDVLQSLDFVDSEAIGAIGHSFGGYNAYVLATVDDRVKALVCSCGFCTFTGDFRPHQWGWRNWYTHLPKITDLISNGEIPFEFHEIAALVAPTPFFNWSGQNDVIFPHWKSIGEALQDLYQLYDWLGVSDRFFSLIGASGHDFPPDIRKLGYNFLDTWLKRKQ